MSSLSIGSLLILLSDTVTTCWHDASTAEECRAVTEF